MGSPTLLGPCPRATTGAMSSSPELAVTTPAGTVTLAAAQRLELAVTLTLSTEPMSAAFGA